MEPEASSTNTTCFHKRLLITGLTERLERTLLLVQERIWRTFQFDLEVQNDTRRKRLIHN